MDTRVIQHSRADTKTPTRTNAYRSIPYQPQNAIENRGFRKVSKQANKRYFPVNQLAEAHRDASNSGDEADQFDFLNWIRYATRCKTTNVRQM